MKRMKKILVLLMAFAMLLCMTAVAFADMQDDADGNVYPYGVYEPSSFEYSGGSGRTTITCEKICIASRVYAYLTFTSTKMTVAKVNDEEFEPDVNGTTTTFRVPVRANKETEVTVTTVAMSTPQDITYKVKVGVDKENLKAVESPAYQDGFYTTTVSTYRENYGYKTDKSGNVTQLGILYPSANYLFPVTVQISGGKIVKVAYTVDPVEYDMGNTSSDFNYLLWAMDGRDVSDASYDYLNKAGKNYDTYNLTPHPVKNGKGMAEQIVEKNGVTGVDTVTSATLTSRAIIDAVDQSLGKAERGLKDDPEPVLPQPDTTPDVIPADGLYIAEGTCGGADLGNNGRVILNVADGKMTAELLYMEQRQSAYPYIYPGTEKEAIAAGESAWLYPNTYDYGGELSSGKFAEGTVYMNVSIRSLDKQLPFVMHSSPTSSNNWFNRVIKLNSDSLVKITQSDLDQLKKNDEILSSSAAMKTKISPLVFDVLKKGKGTAESLTASATEISGLVDELIAKVDAAKAGYRAADVSAVEAAASKLKATLSKPAEELLADQSKAGDDIKADQDALYDTVANAIEGSYALIKSGNLLNSDEVKKAVSGKANYTDASYKVFADAKAALEAALKDDTKTADDINKAVNDVKTAIAGLEQKTASKLTVKGANKTYKLKALKKKAQSYKAVTVKKAAGKVTCTAKGVNGKSKKALKFSVKTGKITVKKGTKKGTYKMKVTVKDAGSAKVKGATKTVTCTVKVK